MTQLSFVVTVFKYLAALMIKVGSFGEDETSSASGQAMIGWLLISLDLSFMGSSVFCVVAAIWVIWKKIQKIRRSKIKLRAFARTVTNHTFTFPATHSNTQVVPIVPVEGKEASVDSVRNWNLDTNEGAEERAHQEVRKSSTE